MRRNGLPLIGLTLLLGRFAAFGGGEEVIVVYNTKMPESKAVADHYVERRGVPKDHVFGLELPVVEEMSRFDFADALQKPLAKLLDERKLWRIRSQTVMDTNGRPAGIEWRVVESKIRYAVLCYGVPLRISPDPNLHEKGLENIREELRRNEAAVDSELALLPMIERGYTLAGPLRNPVFSVTNVALLHPTNGVLLVTRLDGPSPEVARGLVDKAILAEKEGLWGRAYFDLRSITNEGFKVGDDWIRTASQIARYAGFETVVDENPWTFTAAFPMSQIALYAGWYDQDVSGPFRLPVVEFMPGAFAYHLHSYSATPLRAKSRAWVGPLLAAGATATMGCVTEPYLMGTPDIGVFFARFLLQGFSFGEAALASQNTLSWQVTIVGDPLYRPFLKPPQQIHAELEQEKNKLLEWSHLRVANLNLARQYPTTEVVEYLEGLPSTKSSAVLTEKLADLYAQQGKPASALREYLLALTLDPSPQQRLRLRLTAGEKLMEAGRDDEALANYQKLLEETPAFADKVGILRRLVALSRKLGHKEELEKYQTQVEALTIPASTNK